MGPQGREVGRCLNRLVSQSGVGDGAPQGLLGASLGCLINPGGMGPMGIGQVFVSLGWSIAPRVGVPLDRHVVRRLSSLFMCPIYIIGMMSL